MSIPSSTYGQDSESILKQLFGGGIGQAVLGQQGKWNWNRNFVPVNQQVVLIDTSFNELIKVAQNVPHLNIVISRGAEMFSHMQIKHVDSKGEDIKNSDVLKLLNKPNPLQSLEAFLYDFYVYNCIYSSNFGFKNKGSIAALPSFLWWLPPGWMKINATGKIYRQTRIEDIIINYELTNEPTPFVPEEIIHITDGISQSKLSGGSKIEALQLPLSNIVAALKSNNIILTERGLIGFISKESDKDVNGSLPLTTAERDRIEKQYQSDRSLDSNKSHVLVSSASLKWVPMTFDVKQLMLYEGLEDSFGQICGAYGIDRDVFPSIKGATNENKEMGLKATIQNTMQPLGNKLVNRLAEHLGVTDKGEKLLADWSHMPIMKEDELKAEQAKFQKVQALAIMLDKGIISPEQFATLAEVDYDGTPPEPVKVPAIPPIK